MIIEPDILLTIIALFALQGINLYVISRGNGKSVRKAADLAADKSRKHLERQLFKYNPWLKGFDPAKIAGPMEVEEDDLDPER